MAAETTESPGQFVAFDLDLPGMLRRRWGLLLLGVFLGLGVAALYQFATTPIYEADIEILVGQRSSELATSGTATGAQASGDSIQQDQLATHMRLIASRRILAEAIKNESLEELDSFRAAREVGISSVDHILDNLTTGRGGEGSAKEAMVLLGSYRDPSPEDAAAVLNAIYESYCAYVESHNRNTSDEAVQLILQAQVTHEEELAKADREFRKFIGSVPALLEGDQVRDIHKERLSKLEAELNAIRVSLAESTSRLELVERYLRSRSNDQIEQMDQLALLSQTEVERLKLFLDMTRGEYQSEAFQAEQPVRQEMARAQYSRLLDLLQTERTLAAEYGPGHPVVETTRSQIQVIRNFIASNRPANDVENKKKLNPGEMLETYTRLLRNDIVELTRREEILLRQSSRELKLAKKVEADFLKANYLRNKLARAQSRYDEVIERLQEINLAGSYAGFSTDILGAPEVESAPAWPRLSIVMVFGAVLGTLLGLTFCIAAEAVDSTFRDANDLEESLGAPVICHVPRFDVRAMRRTMVKGSTISATVPTFHSPNSSEAEIYRVARTALMLKNRSNDCQLMMVTSPHPGEGKSTTISNLAVSFAQTGKKVLLIDADMRRPTLHDVFGVLSKPGLADILTGKYRVPGALRPSGIENLFIMPHGTFTSEPAELLESRRFTLLIQQCRKAFDLVLIDAPPLLAVADPAIIAPLVDSCLLTVQVRKNNRMTVERAAQLLHDMPVKLTGVIVNSTEERAGKEYGYTSGYQAEQYGYVGYYREYSEQKRMETPAPKSSAPIVHRAKGLSGSMVSTR